MLYNCGAEVVNMDEWTIRGADFVDQLARQDPVFRELRQQHERLVADFDALMETLPETQRDLILDYLNLQLDMEAQKTRLAWMHK